MSHIVEVKTEIRDPVAMQAACQRLGLENPQQGTATLFTQQVSGWIVQLPEWRFPVVVDAGSGQVQYDNYEGRWGDGRCFSASAAGVYRRQEPKSKQRRSVARGPSNN